MTRQAFVVTPYIVAFLLMGCDATPVSPNSDAAADLSSVSDTGAGTDDIIVTTVDVLDRDSTGDATVDAPADAAMEAAIDTGVDVPTDLGGDGGLDAGADAPGDAGVDGAVDVPPTCETGRALCEGRCVDLASNAEHCGVCGTACLAGRACRAGVCTIVCPALQVLCGDRCVSTDTDRAHCGTCGHACAATAVCVAGTCATSCGPGTTRCADDRCHDLGSDPANCGMCGQSCTPVPGSVAVCVDGACGFACRAGRIDCNARAADGCETDVTTDVANCGGCGVSCPQPASTARACREGACSATCLTSFADCNGSSADGCEADVRTDARHCGGCGRACAAGDACTTGACAPVAWAVRSEGGTQEVPIAIARDAAGNVYFTFYYSTYMASSPTLLGTALPNASSLGTNDFVVASVDARGALRWARRYGSTGSDFAASLAVNAGGDVVVGGTFGGTVDFGGGGIAAVGNASGFVLRLDTTGAFVAVMQVPATSESSVSGVVIDAARNVLVTGTFSGTLNLGGTPRASVAYQDVFVAKLSPTWVPAWVRAFGSTASDYGGRLVALADGGTIVTVGTGGNVIDLGGGVLRPENRTLIVGRYGPSGEHVWSRANTGTGNVYVNGIDVDAAGNLYLSGAVEGGTDFGLGAVSSARQGAFLVSYGADGSARWQRTISSPTGTGYASTATVDGAGNVLIAGGFNGSTDLGAGVVTASGVSSGYVATYAAATGALVRVRRLEASVSSGSVFASGAVVGSLGTVLVMGTVGGGGATSPPGFDLSAPVGTANYGDVFVARLVP